MEATVLYGARDVRFEDRPEPTIIEPTDAVIRLPFTCICGSDLWPYRGIQPVSSYSYTRLGRIDDPDALSQALGPRDARVVFSRD